VVKNCFFLLVICVLLSCNKKITPEAWKIVCYQFDQRQCLTDEWAKMIPLNLSSGEKKEKMMRYLETKGIEVVRVGLKPNFHEATCEACDTCPYEHRFFIEINDKNILQLKRLRLLNLSKCNCDMF